jgi:K+-transporting ATPase ATPase C chain
MKNILVSIRMLLTMTLLTGFAYPMAVTGLAKAFWPAKAEGSMIQMNGAALGSSLIAQKFASDKYFWPRPSAADYNASNSTASNYGPCSAALKKAVDDRRAVLLKAHPGEAKIPEDLLFASASGLDPHISPEAARYQIARVVHARKFSPSQSEALKTLVETKIEAPQFGLLGEPRVNVLELNLALDAIK